jgi:Ca2+-binding RTX toxin-like protein
LPFMPASARPAAWIWLAAKREGRDSIARDRALGNDIVGGNGSIFGDAGNDTIGGGFGNDHLFGGTGSDAMYGGLGDDNYYVDRFGDKVVEGFNDGIDTVHSKINYVLATDLENLTSMELL